MSIYQTSQSLQAYYGCNVDASTYENYNAGSRLTAFTVDCTMKPEAKDTVLAIIKREFLAMAEIIDETYFNNAKENTLKWLEESQAMSLGYWMNAIEQQERYNYDRVTDRKELIESITQDDLKTYMKEFLKYYHYSEVVMEPAPK